MTKYIFITGGVTSSLGKGLTASSLGKILSIRGFRVTMQKLDPYLNVDPGTMDPFQHGEVFVTEDGTETDLDIGHYERFLNKSLEGSANVTTGQVYLKVISKERSGDYLGDTVQVIPHITDEIKRRIFLPLKLNVQLNDKLFNNIDIIITEIGGTVGDIESQPFLEAARQINREMGNRNVFFLHVSLVPYIEPAAELKTKPTQHSIATLRAIGIQPDAIVVRSSKAIPCSLREKIGKMCGVDIEAVINAEDVLNIYDIPKKLYKQKLDTYIMRSLRLPYKKINWSNWDNLLHISRASKKNVNIALVGKYANLPDAYISVIEALKAGGFANKVNVKICSISSDNCRSIAETKKKLRNIDGVCIPGGFGIRGIEGKVNAIFYARKLKIPILGLCLGLQSMIIEYARNVVGLKDASSTEFNPNTPYPVITLMSEQLNHMNKNQTRKNIGGTMRLGLYKVNIKNNSLVSRIYNSNIVYERHRHRYEVNNLYRKQFESCGLIFSGIWKKCNLVEFIELPINIHPYYIATQAHPEFSSRPTNPHPLFKSFINKSFEYRNAKLK